MAHPVFKFVCMMDKPRPEISEDQWKPVAAALNQIDVVEQGNNRKSKWAFAESLSDEIQYRYACWWIQNQ